MVLSSKQVCNGRLDWTQNMLLQNGGLDPLISPKPSQSRSHQQQQQPLQCPRCNSTSTKFCYYNNYNRSQPRHFCKTCRRHWTEGGTLRNVPVGGVRKNKRLKTSNTTNTEKNTNNSSRAATNTSDNIIIQQHLHPYMAQENLSQIPQRALHGPLLPLHSDDTTSNKSSSKSSLIRTSFPPVAQISPFVDMSSYHSDLSSSSEHSYVYNPTVDSSIKTEISENGYETSLLTYDELMVLPATPVKTTMATRSETAIGTYQEPDGYWNWDELEL